MSNSIIDAGKRVFDVEIEALSQVRDCLDESFEKIVNAIAECKGRGKVIVTGMGKSGHIASKIAATMASLGTSSFFLHPAEALHGDLGMVSANDIVIAISNSGESDEIVNILPNIKLIGAKIVGISSNPDSTLIKNSDLPFVFPKMKEACNMSLAPTSSTTATLVFGDALAVVLSGIYGFGKDDYALIHPAGSLGKRLLISVAHVMMTGELNATIPAGSWLKDAIVEMGKKSLGMVNVIDENGKLCGIITDGDLRRLLDKGVNIYECKVDDVMTKTPITISSDRLAVDAFMVIKNANKQITAMPVVDSNGILEGTVRIYDIVNKGISA
ncbi:MAG: KpsF/GutQ family sugar-phosphate isomerase [Clostridia bacterium]|nr:KpsF/GutQ family sugar-phosphate isomerase [Clostridia bacterium]